MSYVIDGGGEGCLTLTGIWRPSVDPIGPVVAGLAEFTVDAGGVVATALADPTAPVLTVDVYTQASCVHILVIHTFTGVVEAFTG